MENQGPDVFSSLDQDVAGDVDDDSWSPPDEPMGSHAYGTTLEEERAGEPFEIRDRHTLPEVGEHPYSYTASRVGRLVQPGDEDVDDIDDESNVIAREQDDGGDDSAEEAAMHATDL